MIESLIYGLRYYRLMALQWLDERILGHAWRPWRKWETMNIESRSCRRCHYGEVRRIP
jgi:hypothetical protein